jgi:hypothetical protein
MTLAATGHRGISPPSWRGWDLRGGKDLTRGSVVNIDYIPEQGMLILVDETVLEIIPGKEFHHAILRLWIGSPPQQSIKTGLLGQAG